ncbi:hypothetical protein K9N68_03975 [Kovacikia minuta CCNUW1]|uniref:hypothetical protein n=1 Tax=Kovacikia minuta TaxID=2931930 RepID=UPI001CCDBFAB|nr:hypothetical protein [Kovacikia minuta]UBF27132.1 hypothetical protein K9N68_03975 [Kovacikia minuta CCNUW1]
MLFPNHCFNWLPQFPWLFCLTLGWNEIAPPVSAQPVSTQSVAKPLTVQTGIQLRELRLSDLTPDTFHANFIIWFSWKPQPGQYDRPLAWVGLSPRNPTSISVRTISELDDKVRNWTVESFVSAGLLMLGFLSSTQPTAGNTTRGAIE